MTENKLKRRWKEEDEQAITNAIAGLTAHRQGRKFLWWLLQVGGIGQQPFTANALQMSFNCGMLNVGNKILAEVVRVAPDGYLTMMKESADERQQRDDELAIERGANRPDRGYHGDADFADE